MRVLFLENEDSFSWNVVDALPCSRAEVTVRPGRAAAAQSALIAGYDLVVVGPGPTDPLRAGLVGVVQSVAAAGLPLLGICLGCQALGLAFGARLERATPVHGKTSEVDFEQSRLLPGVRGPHTVMRYHSLALAGVGPPLRVFAATRDGVPMAIEHATLPLAGLQFHPDSYATPRGREMFAAYFEAVR
jgi:anthranilate synthase/aminodeoxychorismate synthase-like glutamine amidotransferase